MISGSSEDSILRMVRGGTFSQVLCEYTLSIIGKPIDTLSAVVALNARHSDRASLIILRNYT